MKARSLFRVLRWVGLGAAVPALWACTSRSLEAPVVKPEQTFTKTFQQTVNRNVDLLFLIDDSSSMRLSQQNLETNFPQFIGQDVYGAAMEPTLEQSILARGHTRL